MNTQTFGTHPDFIIPSLPQEKDDKNASNQKQGSYMWKRFWKIKGVPVPALYMLAQGPHEVKSQEGQSTSCVGTSHACPISHC